MIARLHGTVTSRGKNWVILDVRDVGYIVYCSDRTLSRLPMQDTSIDLYIKTIISSNTIVLYGFFENNERELFCLLTKVQGIGARTALQLLSALAPEQLAHAISTQNKDIFASIKGIGTRLATRLITELSNELRNFEIDVIHTCNTSNVPGVPLTTVAVDAVSALTNLGYCRAEAHAMVTCAENVLAHKMPSPDLGMLLRAALQTRAVQKNGE